MGERGWLDDREQRAWRGLLAMQADVTQYIERTLRTTSGLSRADYEVLALLSEAPPGRLRAFEIGDALRWEKNRLSQHLTRMEKRGLVRRTPCPGDQRGTFVVLTPAGRATIEDAAGAHVAAVRALLLDHVSQAQLESICELADLVRCRVETLAAQPAGLPSDGQTPSRSTAGAKRRT